ncbi:MAG TPA: urea carboxylase-associated family protein, partial [Nitrospira sp.]|nr:urea carboxylase-associated family protein [Nitrospira sp.]
MVMQSTVVLDEVVPAGAPWSGVIRQGQHLRIVDLEGKQAVDFLCYNARDSEERYFAPNTIKAAGTISLTKGHVLYSDQAQPLFTIVEDT